MEWQITSHLFCTQRLKGCTVCQKMRLRRFWPRSERKISLFLGNSLILKFSSRSSFLSLMIPLLSVILMLHCHKSSCVILLAKLKISDLKFSPILSFYHLPCYCCLFHSVSSHHTFFVKQHCLPHEFILLQFRYNPY